MEENIEHEIIETVNEKLAAAARKYCGCLENAAELMEDAARVLDMAEIMVRHSMKFELGNDSAESLPFGLEVGIPSGLAYVIDSEGDEIESDVTAFTATKILAINPYGADFINEVTGDVLHISDLDFTVTPIMIPE